jgi:hypothetical protein
VPVITEENGNSDISIHLNMQLVGLASVIWFFKKHVSRKNCHTFLSFTITSTRYVRSGVPGPFCAGKLKKQTLVIIENVTTNT